MTYCKALSNLSVKFNIPNIDGVQLELADEAVPCGAFTDTQNQPIYEFQVFQKRWPNSCGMFGPVALEVDVYVDSIAAFFLQAYVVTVLTHICGRNPSACVHGSKGKRK